MTTPAWPKAIGFAQNKNQCFPRQVQDSCRAPVTVNVLTPTLKRVRHSRHLHIRCLRSTVPAPAVPCSPMPMVTSVSQMAAYQVCSHPASVYLVDRVLHANCPDVMTFGMVPLCCNFVPFCHFVYISNTLSPTQFATRV